MENNYKPYTIKGSEEFIDLCKRIIRDRVNDSLDKTDDKRIATDDVYVVWYSKVLQNHKALLSTTLPDGMYYELTYNGDKDVIYFDAYKKWKNEEVNLWDYRNIVD